MYDLRILRDPNVQYPLVAGANCPGIEMEGRNCPGPNGRDLIVLLRKVLLEPEQI